MSALAPAEPLSDVLKTGFQLWAQQQAVNAAAQAASAATSATHGHEQARQQHEWRMQELSLQLELEKAKTLNK